MTQMHNHARRWISDRLLVRTGFLNWLADRVLPTEYRVTRLLEARLRGNGLLREDCAYQ